MNIEKLTDSIKQGEGLRLKPYTDTVGKWTIGYGRNLSDNGITVAEAEYLLSHDIANCVSGARIQDWWPFVAGDDVRERAMVEIAFNIGFGGLRSFRKALDALRRRDYNTASAEFLDSLWSRQVGKRAEKLASMIATGQDG